MAIRMVSGLISKGFAAGALVLVLAGCGGAILQSSWRNHEIRVDGSGSEWEKSLTRIENANTALGFYNDRDALYIAVVPWNQQNQIQVAGMGCVMMFESGDDTETIGIHFPFGDQAIAVQMSQTLSRSDLHEFTQELAAKETMLEVLGRDNAVVAKMTLDEAAEKGIRVSLGEYNGHLLVEMRIPWVFELNGKEYHLPGNDGSLVTIDVETPRQTMRQREDQQDMVQRSGISGSPFLFTDPGEEDNAVATGIDLFRMPIDLSIRVRPAFGLE